jgi:hypothetical protein
MNGNAKLMRARGYRVDSRDGRVGSVVAVLPLAGRADPGVLLVQTGLLTCRLVAVPFARVEEVDRAGRRILLGAAPETVQEGALPGARHRIATCA